MAYLLAPVEFEPFVLPAFKSRLVHRGCLAWNTPGTWLKLLRARLLSLKKKTSEEVRLMFGF